MLIYRCRDNGDNFEDALSVFRATPRTADGLSPSRLFFMRQVRIPKLPCLDDQKDEELAGAQLRKEKDAQKTARNERVSKKLASPLTLRVGSRVLLQSMESGLWDKPGKIAGIRDSGRSAHIDVGGKLMLRNRRFIRLDPEYEHDEQQVNAVFKEEELKSILSTSGVRKQRSRNVCFSCDSGLGAGLSGQGSLYTASGSKTCAEKTPSDGGPPSLEVSFC